MLTLGQSRSHTPEPGFPHDVRRHSFTTRLLYTLIPSQVYYKTHTLDMLHEGMVEDMLALYNDGFKVPFLKIYRGLFY